MNKIWNRFRYWSVQQLFTNDEKMLIKIALELNAIRCSKAALLERVMEYDNHKKDLQLFEKLLSQTPFTFQSSKYHFKKNYMYLYYLASIHEDIGNFYESEKYFQKYSGQQN